MSSPPEPTSAALPDAQQILTDNFELIRQVVRSIARRRRLNAVATEELESAVWVHLIDNDYRVLRQFGGRSTLRTFLTVVVTRLALDLRCSELGRWRPSRLARRLGATAMLFETLVFRDGLSSHEAQSQLASEGQELAPDVVQALMRGRSRPRRFVPVDAVMDQLPAAADPGRLLEAVERRHSLPAIRRVLAAALDTLNPHDRRLLRLRHVRGLKVASIAAELGEDQKGLYRRLAVVHQQLRATVEQLGVRRTDVCDLAG